MGTLNRAMVFAVAAFAAAADRYALRRAAELGGKPIKEATDGRYNYRGGPGTAAHKRAAAKHRNVVRNRKAHRA
jgi:hypothetical protein